MTAESRFRISKRGLLVIGIALLAIVVPLTLLVFRGLEGESPTLRWDSPIRFIGPSTTLKGEAIDQKSGLRRLWIAILQQGRETVLLDRQFPRVLFQGEPIRRQPVVVEINVRSLGLEDGEALLRTVVWDQSFRRWWSGNRTYEEKSLIIDTQPPNVDVVSRQHNLNQGGAGLAIYRISEPVVISGVQVADRLFPGSTGYLSDPHFFIAFFAIPYDSSPDTQLYVMATDGAGNSTRVGFTHYINNRGFAQDELNVSETFLKKKMPEFESFLEKEGAPASLIDRFVVVNRELRQANHRRVQEICKNTDAKIHWEGPFLRLPASARQAGFGDHRTYLYEGQEVDQQTHLGLDLASTAHSPVPVSNNGRIVFADNLGIYGRTVLVDHGFGLFSMYGHLSHVQATPGQLVSKGDVIGSTGSTGLAGGDHLHFAILIHHTFVNPVEWWDPNWIKHNVTDKLEEIAQEG
jgi:murein DD-endopeptidase MepM/ murein hydrolase activator NlpD